MTTQTKNTRRAVLAGIAAAVLSAGCSDFLDVQNPGLIEDATLNSPTVIAPLVVGIAADYANAMNTVTQVFGEMSFELTACGPQVDPYTIGVLDPTSVDSWWTAMQKSRWVAEAGVERIKKLLPAADYAKSAQAAKANMYAGFANRLLGENVCQTVIDGGAAEPKAVHFARAEGYFTQAITLAQAAGTSANDIYYAALAGRASVKAWQKNWTGAAQDAALVPNNFSYKALYNTSTTREENALYGPSYLQFYTSVYGTPWADLKDPRTPFNQLKDAKGATQMSRDGRIPLYAEAKYPLRTSDIPIVSGVEMLTLRAEERLRAKDLAGMTTLLNTARSQFAGMTPLTQPATEAAAWTVLKVERGANTWLEARRFWDLSRWYDEGLDTSLKDRARCLPIGKTELLTNPNLKGLL